MKCSYPGGAAPPGHVKPPSAPRSHKRRTVLEKQIQREIEADLGAEPDLLLLRNSVGEAKYFNGEGKEYFVPYGLGEGSPDLVGLLRINTPMSSVWHLSRDGTADTHVTQTAPIALWFCLEVKAAEGELEEDQRKVHAIWRRFGAFIEVVRSKKEARAALERARRIGV